MERLCALKGMGFSSSVESREELLALASDGMPVAAINLPQGLKPSSIFAFDDVYVLKSIPFTKADCPTDAKAAPAPAQWGSRGGFCATRLNNVAGAVLRGLEGFYLLSEAIAPGLSSASCA
jgi:hypothetical protein